MKQVQKRTSFTTKKGDGGKGLQIVYQILDNHNGTLRVSRDPAENTARFEVDLPYNNSTS